MKLNNKPLIAFALTVSLGVLLGGGTGCGNNTNAGTGETGNTGGATTGTPTPVANLSGKITIDGSSTVYPISQAVAEEFMKANKDVDVTVSSSGTGGGMKKFVLGEIDICDASRPIKPEEVEKCKANGIEFIELPVAFDGLSVVVNKENNWVDHLTVAELNKMWEEKSTIKNWKDVRAGFPDVELKLFGPGTDSGTFEYFTEAINKKAKSSRSDYTPSEDDNVLVTGVKGEKGGLGYFGFAYYVENKDSLKVVKIDNGAGPIEPSETTINDGTYAPLSRPIFIYVTKKALERPEVKEYVKFYLSTAGQGLVKESGYVALPAGAYATAQKHADELKTGTRFHGVQPGMKIEDVLAADGK